MNTLRSRIKALRGFTLVELAVVIVIIGVLAAFGVPRFLKSVERSKASEAFAYLSAVRSAQERYLSREGTYATNITDLDISVSAPKYFSVGEPFTAGTADAGADGSTPTATLQNSWTLTLTRTGNSGGYGDYTVTFGQNGYNSDVTKSTIETFPDINPMVTTSTSTGGSGGS